MLDLIVSVPDHCLSFYLETAKFLYFRQRAMYITCMAGHM